MQKSFLAITTLLCLALTGCQPFQEISKIYLSATPDGRKLLERWEHYESIADKLKHYHDDGQLDSNEVLDVLADAGIVLEPLPYPGPRPPSPSGQPPSPLPSPPPPPGGRWAWPMKAGVVSSEFGLRGASPHEGLDVAADPGEPIYAAAAGTVIYAGSRMSGYGNALIVQHDDRTTSLYAHATTLTARQGASVSRGAEIATVGTTGRSTGPHLHFEVRVGKTPINPREVLPRQPF